MLVALTIVSCQKKETETTPKTQDVSFNAIEVIPDVGLKSTADWECKSDVPTNAWVNINGEDYYPELFTVGDDLFTQSIKLEVGTNYCVQDFVLYKESGDNEGYQAGEDITTHGTPHSDSDYAPYVTESLDYCFDVTAFEKVEIPLEVLCFQDAEYSSFGFDWFAITKIVIRQFCFFGDICIDDPSLYENDQYYSQGGVNVDEEAVFRVVVMNGTEEVPYSPFSNEAIYGSGSVMCVDYPDNLSEVDDFTFELQLWQPDANGNFMWQTYATFYSQDDGDIYDNDQYTGDPVDGTDGVVDFAVGSCSPDSYPIYDWIFANSNTIESTEENGTLEHRTNVTHVGQTFSTGPVSKQLAGLSIKLSGPANGGTVFVGLHELDTNTGDLTYIATSNSHGIGWDDPYPASLINSFVFPGLPTLDPNKTYAFLISTGGWNFFQVVATDNTSAYPGGTTFTSASAGTSATYNPVANDLWFDIELQ